ncbi:MAG TPA: HlyD family efflux transporter periplasmic adaptor subunit [Candidatus Acidoferrum sp.]|nr:HlyD family efflux transporter periplasmic adaptor subunit [Candidatus Acidoferrum sp.]
MRAASILRSKPRLVLGALALLILALLPRPFVHLRHAHASGSRADSIYHVEKKKFSQTLRLNGTTMAAHSFAVLAPRLEGSSVGSMVITKLAPAGSPVRKDDFLVEFDAQAQQKDYLDKKATYDNLVGQVAQKQAEEDIARAKDDTGLQKAEDELKRAQLEMKRNEIVSRIDAEKNQEAVDEAQATLKQLKETYQLKRAAAAAGIRILEIQRDRAREAMRYAQSNASKMTVRSPMPGVVVYNTIWLGSRMGTVQQGDQVEAGLPFMSVVDPSQMEVRVDLNQVDLLKVRPGMHAKMRLDAYPGIELAATLEDLSPLGHNGQFTDTIRIFSARFSVQGTDPKLLPDLSAALDLDLGSEENVLVVPCQSVDFDSGNHPFVWVENSGSFEKRSVKTGPRSDTEIVVLSGLKEGDIIHQSATSVPESGGRP